MHARDRVKLLFRLLFRVQPDCGLTGVSPVTTSSSSIEEGADAEAESNLQEAVAEIRSCKTFADLHDLVRREIGRIAGIGRVTINDVATRIGAHLDLAPERVYLHAGTAAGAKALGIKAGETVNRSPAWT